MQSHIELLRQWESHEKAVNAAFDMLAAVIGYRFIESPFWTPIQAQRDAYRDLVTEITGMTDVAGGWLNWWVYENDFGDKRLGVCIDGKDTVPETIEELYEAVKSSELQPKCSRTRAFTKPRNATAMSTREGSDG